jgi:hypothetical protein
MVWVTCAMISVSPSRKSNEALLPDDVDPPVIDHDEE